MTKNNASPDPKKGFGTFTTAFNAVSENITEDLVSSVTDMSNKDTQEKDHIYDCVNFCFIDMFIMKLESGCNTISPKKRKVIFNL